jgi:hypothetical protein
MRERQENEIEQIILVNGKPSSLGDISYDEDTGES